MKTGRNEPCPCGSGKKYKRCCWGNVQAITSMAATKNAKTLVEGKDFHTMDELQRVMKEDTEQVEKQDPRNTKAVKDFQGLNAVQMNSFFEAPFDSEEIVHFPSRLKDDPPVEMALLFKFLAEAIGKKGVKATKYGTLPKAIVKKLAFVFFDGYPEIQKVRVKEINAEGDFFMGQFLRMLGEASGLLLNEKGRIKPSPEWYELDTDATIVEIYPRLFKGFVTNFDWAWNDKFAELKVIKESFIYTLFLLERFGDKWRPGSFYENAFLKAFPLAVKEIAKPVFDDPKEEVRKAYSERALELFLPHFGLAELKRNRGKDGEDLSFEIKKTPLLSEVVHFSI